MGTVEGGTMDIAMNLGNGTVDFSWNGKWQDIQTSLQENLENVNLTSQAWVVAMTDCASATDNSMSATLLIQSQTLYPTPASFDYWTDRRA